MLDNLWTIDITDTDNVTPLSVNFEKDTHADNTALYLDQMTIDDPTLPPHLISLKRVRPKAAPDFYGTKRFYATIRMEKVIPQPTGDRLTPMITYINGTRPLGFSAQDIGQHDKLVRAILASTNWDKFTVRGEI